jgi:NAD(P)H-flavin reductase
MRTSLPQPARIGQVIAESAKVKTFIIEASLEAEPGQFVMVWLPRVNEKPFSLVDADPLTLTVARVGPFTSALHELRVGEMLWFAGGRRLWGSAFGLPGQGGEGSGARGHSSHRCPE